MDISNQLTLPYIYVYKILFEEVVIICTSRYI